MNRYWKLFICDKKDLYLQRSCNYMDANIYLQEHSEELSRKYPGKYVAVVDEKIVAVSSSAAISYKKAKEQAGSKEIAIFYISSDEERIILI